MPFDPLYQLQYERVIRPAVEGLGLVCVRGDEVYSKPNVVADLWKAIRQARVIIAELTTRNPNVLYEIGLAHAIGKPTILLTRNEDDVPFDLKALRYRYYDTNDPFWGTNLAQAIKSMVRNVLDEPGLSAHLDDVNTQVEFPENPRETPVPTRETQEAIDVSGTWQGSWRRTHASIEHEGTLSIRQHGAGLSGAMTVTFVKSDDQTIVHEELVGAVADRKVTLNGVSYTYIQQAQSSSYLLDNYEMEVSPDGTRMEGEFRSSRGKGSAVFERQGGGGQAGGGS
jgi:hypothetical protein